MYYKITNIVNKIHINSLADFKELYETDSHLCKQITILDISNPENSKINQIDTLKELPDFTEWTSLVTLKANCHKLTKFPKLPSQIELVEFKTNSIEEIPNLSQYTMLESLNLKDNYIESIPSDYIFPESLRSLNMGFNKIRTFESPLPQDLAYLNLEYNFLLELPNYIKNHESQKVLNNNETDLIPVKKVNINNFWDNRTVINNNPNMYVIFNDNDNYNRHHMTYRPPVIDYGTDAIPKSVKIPIKIPIKTTYDNGQNVHNHNIQESFRQSIKNLIDKVKNNNHDQLPELNMRDVHNMILEYYNNHAQKVRQYNKNRNVLYVPYYWFKGSPKNLKGHWKKAYDLITLWNTYNYTHSGIEYTYGQILSAIISIIKSKDIEEQHEILKVLIDETIQSENVCTTGKFSRLANVLNGFDETIKVELNQNEIINNRLIVIRRKHEKTENTTAARKEAEEMLKEFELKDDERQALIQTVEY